ncbi:hypothetical protein M3Y97_00517700 [Aphelenchoides bicaudatus]|nr:hypothetical protein M3Y97_00517700 [Aphelenchoides bicaudatus]
MDEMQGDSKQPIKTNQSNSQMELNERSQTSLSVETTMSGDFAANKTPSTGTSPQTPEKRELLLHNEFIEVPSKLFKNENVLRNVITKEAFYSLSESARTHLINTFLTPTMASNMDDTLDFIFSKEKSVSFVPPITNFYNRVQVGFYNRPHGSDCVQLRDFHKVLHNHFIRNHHLKLLRQLVRARHQILENASKQGAFEEVVPKSRPHKRKPKKNEKLMKRSKKRVAMMLSKVNEVVGVENIPSSDESGSEDARIPLTMFREAESTLFNLAYKDCDLDLHQPTELPTVKDLLRQYKELREKNPECPSLRHRGYYIGRCL